MKRSGAGEDGSASERKAARNFWFDGQVVGGCHLTQQQRDEVLQGEIQRRLERSAYDALTEEEKQHWPEDTPVPPEEPEFWWQEETKEKREARRERMIKEGLHVEEHHIREQTSQGAPGSSSGSASTETLAQENSGKPAEETEVEEVD
jgi:hypothetical protein